MKAVPLLRRRVVVAVDAFVEVVIWHVPEPVPPSTHELKYRLAYVVEGRCVLRYDNERGAGDHRHTEAAQEPYNFVYAGSTDGRFRIGRCEVES